MDKAIDQRIQELEALTTFLHANTIALQTTLVAALVTINKDPATRASFINTMRGAAEGSYDHAVGMSWTDQMIAISRQGMAAFVGKDIAREIGLP